MLLYLAANERRREKQVQIPSGQSVGAKDFIMEHGNGRTKKDFSIDHILSHSSRPAEDDTESNKSAGNSSDDEEDSECLRVSSPNDPQITSSNGHFANPLTHSWLQDYGTAAYFGRSEWPISHPIRPPFFTLQGINLIAV